MNAQRVPNALLNLRRLTSGSAMLAWGRRAAPARGARREHGQVLVLVVLGMVGMLAMAAIVVDGGNAWAQQRATQNGADSAAEAGAVVLVQQMSGSNPTWTNAQWDSAVNTAVSAAASGAQNNLSSLQAYYTDVNGNLLTSGGATTADPTDAAVVGAGAVPTGAAGVQTQGDRTFNTYFAGVIGLSHITTPASATAVAGVLVGISGTPVLPVTFPVTISTCSGSSNLVPGQAPWPIVDPAHANASNEAIVPLCKTGPGSVGWLDLGGSSTLAGQITTPSTASFTLPLWLQTKTGDANSVDTAMNAYDGQMILLPMFDGTCKTEPSSTDLTACTTPGVGNNTYYHIPQFTGFLLDHAYIQGNNFPACNSTPGAPAVGGNGSTGCLKGWFVKRIESGEVVAGSTSNGPAAMGVQLIK